MTAAVRNEVSILIAAWELGVADKLRKHPRRMGRILAALDVKASDLPLYVESHIKTQYDGGRAS